MDQHSFLFQAMVYLAAAVVMVPVSKKLGLGSVLGYLLAGIAIGPALLGFIGSEGEDIMHFAEFGVVMMLFIIGLELEPQLLWRLRKAIAGLGGLQVFITGCIGAGIAYLLGLDWRASVAAGMIVSLSSTAIVLQTLNEKGLIKTRAGQSSFAVLLFQDIAVIPMLALFPLLALNSGESDPNHTGKTLVSGMPGWGQALVVLGSVAAIIVAGRFLIRPLFRIVAATRLREVFTATALLLVVGIAELMTQVGLSPALGTFLAGVVLANSEYKHELESDIDPFKGLLLGLFFVAVGASINFHLIFREPLTIFGLVLLLMVFKALILFTLGRFARLGKSQNLIFSLSLSQVGEFAFVLISFCLHEGIFSKDVTDTMMAVVAISMALTPVVLLINDKVLQPRLMRKSPLNEKEADQIDEKNAVIIAGFGHFGNTVGRFLRAHNIGATVLDTDPDRVDLLRKMGFKVYYGDASRHDLLEAAGAADARIMIIALEPSEKRLEMIETVKKHFPQLRMFVRATNRYDAYDLMNAGMMHVYRETLDTSLRLGVDVMKVLGHGEFRSSRAARKFLKYDEENMKKLASIRDPEEYISMARSYIEELETMLRDDMRQSMVKRDDDEEAEAMLAVCGILTKLSLKFYFCQPMEEIIEQIRILFAEAIHRPLINIDKLPQSGSDRIYFRIHGDDATYIATYGKNIRENRTFIYFTKHFLASGCPVPRIFAVNAAETIYIQEDFGDVSLMSRLDALGKTQEVYALFQTSLRQLSHLQISGNDGLDYSKCITSREFGKQAILSDLLYFKYYFLDTLQTPYDKEKLLEEFEHLSSYLTQTDHKYFMFRDFQSRNVMIRGHNVHFIDYQGGMKGALQYDVASMLWQARAELPEEWKSSLLEYYMDCVEDQLPEPLDRDNFKSQYNGYVLIRLLQVLGAYGFRGLFERKAHFLTSIPLALRNVKTFLDTTPWAVEVPEFDRLLRLITGDEIVNRFQPVQANEATPLVVHINSFSYKKGIPADQNGNGGGFVFDCRGLLNPGRYEEFKKLTGRDKSVQDFLEQRTKMAEFLNSIYTIVDISVEDYIKRGFKNLQVSFGCTGGQHRSVFAADSLARHLRNKFKVNIELNHVEQESKKWINN